MDGIYRWKVKGDGQIRWWTINWLVNYRWRWTVNDGGWYMTEVGGGGQ